ncbi:hypothetical protein DFI02_1011299 [Rhizobium sp. PP-F2F-G20b]|nr:hypothetical protein DFI02_1011299 [Rhizobium sp. PP-F2F-G20b]
MSTPEETAADDNGQYIFRASMLLPDGRRIYARQYGKRAFKIPVGSDNDNGGKAA